MLIIPAIDIINGECARLTRGDFATKKIYSKNPLAVARQFEKAGADMVHIVDLDGAKLGRPINKKLILKIRNQIKIPLQVGGGIRTVEDAESYLNAGVDRIVIGTQAARDLDFIKKLLSTFGRERIVIGVDIKNGVLAIDGWTKTAQKKYTVFAKELRALGVSEIVCTDIRRDGTLTEPNFTLLEQLQSYGFNVVASGGVSDTAAIEKLSKLKLFGAIIGKALYEKKISLAQAKRSAELSNLTKRIIPCLDVKNGRVVKGVNFKDLKDAGDPVELGKKYSEEGADELVFLDITASKEKRKTVADMVKRIAQNIFIPFTVGGGIRSVREMRILLGNGADKISINTAAVLNPSLIKEGSTAFGAQCIVVAIDAQKINGEYMVLIRGGSEVTKLDVVTWAKTVEKLGAGEILLTSMDRDGTKKGFDIEFLNIVNKAVNIPIIAPSMGNEL
ncbi:MAG: 1-(5-phosphoribosyl)-5-((5-phosphoribosylamino)methylideneamino) imidazole-4-carboxamide isomerase [Candidatus Peregrinibacteria bacterium GW2011_GWA2_47_7]|nr:MAG: 1-(5-phosphoribosyl)-5-((5-phosphoribosylamino)methylideneamino) imidazole-4-carboxamide isomerase [Candidatus Peregrinibacteria bacterium GW2011_GWA2_47_7]